MRRAGLSASAELLVSMLKTADHFYISSNSLNDFSGAVQQQHKMGLIV